MSIKLEIDVEKIAAEFGKFAREVEEDLKAGVAELAGATHSMIVEKSAEELKSSRKTFQDNLKFEEIQPGVWVITIKKPALWIEDGIPSNYDMKEALLKNAKTSPTTGNKYKIIPFDHGKPPTQMAPYNKDVAMRIKKKLSDNNINFKKIEVDEKGSPRVGKLHTLDFGGEKPGQGNTPVMKGINIYQTAKGGKVRRDILTFRTVSSGPASAGKWHHPGLKGKQFIERAYQYASDIWEREVLPKILEKWR